jgi:hypothetical protein
MTQPSFATHEVFNQSPPFGDVDLFALDQPLNEAVAANGGAGAEQELSDFGRRWGSAVMAERGRIANEVRRRAGLRKSSALHASTWRRRSRPVISARSP